MDEGFSDVKLKYLGSMWVMFEFDKVDTKVNMMQHIGVKSWFHVIQDAVHDFVSDERIVWVDIEGIPLNVWSRETFMRIGKKWGETLDIEDNIDSYFGRKRLCIKTKQLVSILKSFKIIFKENDQGAKEFSSFVNAKVMNNSREVYQEINRESVDPNGETIVSGDFNEVRSIDEIRGSCFNPSSARVLDHFISSSGLVDVKLEWCYTYVVERDLSKYAMGKVKDVNSIPNLRSLLMDEGFSDVKLMYLGGIPLNVWSRETFMRIGKKRGESKAVGNSSGILCVWEANVFKKDYATISDNFVSIYGTWLPSNSKILFVAIYAPQQASCKRVLWDARGFDHFISSSGLVDVKLESCRFGENVSRDKIRLAVWNCGENKSPGPDGYTFEFFRKYWNIVGPNFCEAVEYFFETGLFSKGCNSSFVVWILKVADAKFVDDFRPISLIRSVYKVVTKILANRLALVIADLVFDTQSAFVANRQILDGPFILNEILHWCKRKKKQAMFFKVDFAKAYDSVRWDYLLDVLEAFGFGQTWCK
nr:RNA-directed DNA polymerase, eukaryota [Tanacetum cinerariifolium]